jgi:hypothetical protein
MSFWFRCVRVAFMSSGNVFMRTLLETSLEYTRLCPTVGSFCCGGTRCVVGVSVQRFRSNEKICAGLVRAAFFVPMSYVMRQKGLRPVL